MQRRKYTRRRGFPAARRYPRPVSRYTPPSGPDHDPPYRRRSRSVRIGVWVLLVGVVALVFADVVALLL